MTKSERIGQARRSKRWALKNVEKKKMLAREWYVKNRGLTIARARLWAEQNPESYRERLKRWNEINTPGVTARKRAISESLTALFEILPHDGWRRQLAHEILNSSSGQTLCWVDSRLEDHVATHTNI